MDYIIVLHESVEKYSHPCLELSLIKINFSDSGSLKWKTKIFHWLKSGQKSGREPVYFYSAMFLSDRHISIL